MSFVRHLYGILYVFVMLIVLAADSSKTSSLSDLLTLGDSALAENEIPIAINHYRRAIVTRKDDDPVTLVLSLYTNLGTALSSMGSNEQAKEAYKTAVLLHSETVNSISDEASKKELDDLTAQTAFFLGMVYQDLGEVEKAASAYGLAHSLDEFHWSSIANLGALFQDELRRPGEAIDAYNEAYRILTQREVEPTDFPNEPQYILSQLQFRIGMCIISSPDRLCAVDDDPATSVDCKQLAANAFSTAIQYDSDNDAAKHMLASVTADATVKRASNSYVTALFDEYAKNFEKSLVSDLKYNGFETLRRGFDKAFGGQDKVPSFSLVVDAGCGTGLVGEQFRNVSENLIGVDLSETIMEEARISRPDLYNDTRVGDVCDVFRELRPISLIIAADSYIYFGDLVPLFESMEEGLVDGGYAAFTLENVEEDSEKSLLETSPDWRWQLTASGRFAHRRDYVESIGSEHSLTVVHYEPLINFRYENGRGVRGHLFVMRKELKIPEL